jgi:radical SAM superfamily enzyme YgiQ (UPF0313 family)
MARVLLVNPPSEPLSRGNRRATRVLYPPPPGGIASVAGSLRAAGHDVFVADMVLDSTPPAQWLAILARTGPDAIGYSVLGPTVDSVAGLAAAAAAACPGVAQFAGNAMASEYPAWIFDRIPELQAVVVGEGEASAVELIDSGLARDVDGVRRRGQTDAHYRPRPQIEDLDALPFPAWDLFAAKRYRASPQLLMRSQPTLGLLQTRGCPWRCSFCAQNFLWPGIRSRSADSIAEEMAWLVRDLGIVHFGFYDSIFPMRREFGEELYRAMERRGLLGKVRFFCETRCDMVWPETFGWLKRAGLHLVFLGIESPSAELLRRHGKVRSMFDVREAVTELRRLDLRSYGLFVIGLPGQGAEDYETMGRFARSLPLDIASFGIYTRYPGGYGVRAEADVDPASLAGVNWAVDHRGLGRTQQRLMREFYLRPGLIARHLLRREIRVDRLLAGAGSLLLRLA